MYNDYKANKQMVVIKEKVRVAAYIHENLKKEAEKVAKSEGRSLSNYIEQLIRQDVKKQNSAA